MPGTGPHECALVATGGGARKHAISIQLQALPASVSDYAVMVEAQESVPGAAESGHGQGKWLMFPGKIEGSKVAGPP
jgi:hypothetical protein